MDELHWCLDDPDLVQPREWHCFDMPNPEVALCGYGAPIGESHTSKCFPSSRSFGICAECSRLFWAQNPDPKPDVSGPWISVYHMQPCLDGTYPVVTTKGHLGIGHYRLHGWSGQGDNIVYWLDSPIPAPPPVSKDQALREAVEFAELVQSACAGKAVMSKLGPRLDGGLIKRLKEAMR
jgi:hypothetical protein